MKNQGVWVMRLIMAVLCVFIVGYMGVHVFRALYDPLRTVTCVLLETEDALSVSGLFVWEEALIDMPGGTLRYAVADGERVSAGQTVAVQYQDASVLATVSELRTLENHLQQLEYIDGRTVSASDSAQLTEQIRGSLRNLMSTVDSGRLLSLTQNSLELRAALFRQEYTLYEREDLPLLIEETSQRIALLTGSIAQASQTVTAPRAGLFVSTPDGLEQSLKPDLTQVMTPHDFRELYRYKPNAAAGEMAKLVVSESYQYIFVLPEAQAKKLGQAVTLRLSDETSAFTHRMNVERISEPVDGECLVTLSSNRYQARFFGRRRMDADIVFSEHSGLRVPRDAIRVDDEGGCYVYCLVVGKVVKKPVAIILEVERGNYYLIEYQASGTGSLLPGDEIIVDSAEPLYDGRVLG